MPLALVVQRPDGLAASFTSQSRGAARGVPAPPAVLDVRARYNPTLSSRWFVVPGIVALLTQVVTLLVVGLSVARERETGTFDQLLVTPMRPIDILLGKGLPSVLIGVIEASVIIVAAVWWFDVPLRGGMLALYLGLLLFVIAVTGIGLMISSLAVTQQQALLGAFLFMVPSIILSGFATPIANMPDWVQDLTLINPMRYFLVIVRGVFLEGASMSSLASQYWPMAIIGVASSRRRRMAVPQTGGVSNLCVISLTCSERATRPCVRSYDLQPVSDMALPPQLLRSHVLWFELPDIPNR